MLWRWLRSFIQLREESFEVVGWRWHATIAIAWLLLLYLLWLASFKDILQHALVDGDVLSYERGYARVAHPRAYRFGR